MPIGSRFGLVAPEPHQVSQQHPLNFAVFYYQDSGVTEHCRTHPQRGSIARSTGCYVYTDIRSVMDACNKITTQRMIADLGTLILAEQEVTALART